MKRAFLDAALTYARYGWHVFPVYGVEDGHCACGQDCKSPAKHPLTKHGLQDATRDESTIRKWWARWPNANVGINCGASSLAVVDVDTKGDVPGMENWRELVAEYGRDIEATCCVETPSGGLHFYFSVPDEVHVSSGNSKLAAGIDVKSQGGYVVAPPSVTPVGEYLWALGCEPECLEPVQLPDALHTRLAKQERGSVPLSPDVRVRKPVSGEIDRVRRALKRLSQSRCDRYDEWLAVGMALRELGDDGLDLWDEWSQGSPSYRPGVCAAKWATFGSYEGRPLTLASLYAWARDDSGETDPATLLSDVGNAHRFVNRYGDRFRYCAPLGGWLYWDGKRWARDTDGAALRAAMDTMLALYDEASAALREAQKAIQQARDAATNGGTELDIQAQEQLKSAAQRAHRLLSWANKSQAMPRLDAMLRAAAALPPIASNPEQYDADPWLLNVANGTLDLRTNELHSHTPSDLLTKLAPVDFDPTAKGEAWTAHLELFLPDDDVRRQVQRDLGMSLVGTNLEEMFPIWYGIGANGKSTTARVIQAVLGDYVRQAAPNLLIERRHEQHPTEMADLAGARAVFSTEVGRGARLDEAKVKALTGGDMQKARYMRQDFFEFPQTWTILLLVNHKPSIAGTDNGIWRRVRLIPWDVSLAEDDERRRPQGEVIDEMVSEGAAVLGWLVEGLRDWQREPRWRAATVSAATSEYRGEQDRLAAFVGDCCVEGPHLSAPASELYETYESWAQKVAQEPLSKNRFGEALRERGYQSQQRRVDGRMTRLWLGIGLLHEDGDDDSLGAEHSGAGVPNCTTLSGYPSKTQNSRFPRGDTESAVQSGTDSRRASLIAQRPSDELMVDDLSPWQHEMLTMAERGTG